MSFAVSHLSAGQRALEKQESRRRDAARLNDGSISGADLRRENGLGSRLPLHRYQMSAIGGRSIRQS